MRIVLFFSLFLLITGSGCREFSKKRIRGNGNIRTETRSVGQFRNVSVSGSIDLYLKQDSVFSARVETDENLIGYVRVDNRNGKLYIEQEDHYRLNPSRSIKVFVSGSMFHVISASGACDMYSENQIISDEPVEIRISGASDADMNIKAPIIKTDLSGAGTIKLQGETREFKADVSGSSDIRCFGLLTENALLKISGAGSAEVFASQKLDVRVSGAASVRYKGNPVVNQSVSGAGSVKKVD